ncbi:hypothetical protein Sa4125_47850 (plasmid) [Aureimonas sp. SA4125]|nr:hypothetical protein Sa4125_47850 [Aureimonas sp. SA4125]
MVASKQALPETMVSPETGETLRREVRSFVVAYKGEAITVALPGYYPAEGDDGVHIGDDMAVVDAALRSQRWSRKTGPAFRVDRLMRRTIRACRRGRGIPRNSKPRSRWMRSEAS